MPIMVYDASDERVMKKSRVYTMDETDSAISTGGGGTGGVSEGEDILSTGETGGNKFLREDGDGTSSWQTIPKYRSQRMTWAFPDSNIDPTSDIQNNEWHTLSCMWYHIDNSGDFVKRDTDVHGTNFYYTEANALLARKNCTVALVNISVESATALNALCSDSSKRSALVTEMISFCEDNNFDGVDLDIETFQVANMSDNNYVDFKIFLTELGTELHNEGLLLSLEVPAVWNTNPNTESGSGDAWDVADSEAYYRLRIQDLNHLPVDQVVIMIYDYMYDYSVGEPQQPLKWLEETLEYNRSIINEDRIKIVAGLPSVGYSGVTGSYAPTERTYDYLSALPGFSGASRDAASGEIIWADGGSTYCAIDDTAIQLKVERAEEVGVYAYALWHCGENKYGGTDFTTLNTDTRQLNTVTYKTKYIDAKQMIASTTNGAPAGSNEYGTNDIDWDYHAFDGGGTEESIHFKFPMPEDWDRGTVKAKFYWSSAASSTNGDTVEWGIQAGALSDDDAIDASLGTAQVISDTLLADNGTDLQITDATPSLTVGGTPALGDMITWKVYRNTDGTDDMTEDAWLFGVLIQYKANNVSPEAW